MQIDMHYYGTYAMARAAGINADAAKIIATAAQYVDDAAETTTYRCRDKSCIHAQATGHHASNIQNLLPIDQRHVWVPFHFLPGNTGSTFEERLQCGKDSTVAKDMVKTNLALALSGTPFALELLGITAHVYADTFSHFGFSGIGSDLNRVKNDTINVKVVDPEIEQYIKDKANSFFSKNGIKGIKAVYQKAVSVVVGGGAELLANGLGHGAVATYPDRPYLSWDFQYEQGGRSSARDNRESFLEACEALHAFFSEFSKAAKKYSDPRSRCEFKDIRDRVSQILKKEADAEGRIATWQQAVKENRLYDGAEETIPAYSGDAWDSHLKDYDGLATPLDATQLPVYRFHQAASYHRHAVLRHLLPSQKLLVV